MEKDLSQTAALCRSGGCGFYGSSATDGFCSKCYRDAVKRKQTAPSSSSTTTSSSSSGASSNNSYSSSCESSSNLPVMPPSTNIITTTTSTCDSNLNTGTPTVSSTISGSKAEGKSSIGDKETKEKEDNNNQAATANLKQAATEVTTSPQSEPIGQEEEKEPPKNVKKKKTRCTKCKVSVGVIGFPCRCGGIFCSAHRYANEHSCTFDYKEHGAEEIRKNNPQVVGEKIQKI